MKKLDYLLQSWRISKVAKFIPPGARVLDIGCSEGELFKALGPKLGKGIGIDPALNRIVREPNYELRPGVFPQSSIEHEKFDAVTMLAVAEHIPLDQQKLFATTIPEILEDGGKFLLTVPAPSVDYILDMLKLFRLIDGMALEEHFGFDVKQVPQIYKGPTLSLKHWKRFQLGLNNLFVFEKIPTENIELKTAENA